MNTRDKINSERRSLRRFKLQLESNVITCRQNKKLKTIKLLTRDISSGGAFLKTSDPLTVGTKVKMDLIIDIERIKKLGGKKALVNLSGLIIRTGEDGMAISFEQKFDISPLDDS